MSEDSKIVEEQAVADAPTTDNNGQVPEVGEYIAESKKYRQRAQTAEAELNELKENLKLQETKQLEEKEEFKSLYEKMKEENLQLKPVVEQFQIQEKQRREHLLSQLSDDEQEIYVDLPTMKLEKHIERLGSKKVQISDAKEVTSSGKFAGNSKWNDLSDSDREKARKNPKLWKQIVDGYRN
jgi:ribosomal protein L9